MKKLEFALLLMDKKDKWKRAENKTLEESPRTPTISALRRRM
jgi:hypothetical protein